MAVIVLTTTGGSTTVLPLDFNPSNNTIDCYGYGSIGESLGVGTGGASGGGGGAFARKNNYALTPGGTYTYYIGGPNDGNTLTYFNDFNVIAATGSEGISGGIAANCAGDLIYAGGDGGTDDSGDITEGSAGGGGCAGPDGAGITGHFPYAFDLPGAAGGEGDNNTGGGGSGGPGGNGSNGSNGGNGTPPVYSGGGGGGGAYGFNGGAGGNYGAGGGGDGGGGTAGAGKQGVIVITYVPLIKSTRVNLLSSMGAG